MSISPASLAEPGEKRLGDRYCAEDVHVELTPHLFERRLFKHALVAIAGIVDQDVDGAVFFLCLRHDARHAVELRDIADDRPDRGKGSAKRRA